MRLKNDKIEVIEIESLEKINERKVNKKIKEDFEKYLKDPVFMALVKKYAKESEEFNKNKPAIEREHDKIIKRVFTSKREAARFIRKVLKIDVKAKDLELVQNSFVTIELKYREADIVYKIKEKTKEKEVIYSAMEVLLGKKIGKEKAEEIMKKIIEEGSDYMLAAEEMIIKENEMIRTQGRAEGISIGEARGRKKGISIGQNNIIKILFKNKMQPKEISEKTGIALSEILRIVK